MGTVVRRAAGDTFLRLRSLLLLLTFLCACGSSAASGSASSFDVHVRLRSVPRGEAWVTAGDASPVLHLELSGLQPASNHPADLSALDCVGSAATIPPLAADAFGNVAASVPVTFPAHGGACLRIHAGPGLDDEAQAHIIAHGVLKTLVNSRAKASAIVAGSSTTGPSGSARLRYDPLTRVLTVDVEVEGLAPGTSHPNHIHFGQCRAQGPVREALRRLVAGRDGRAHASTRIPQSDGIKGGVWYVAVHQGPGLGTQAQFSPVLCGDVPRA